MPSPPLTLSFPSPLRDALGLCRFPSRPAHFRWELLCAHRQPGALPSPFSSTHFPTGGLTVTPPKPPLPLSSAAGPLGTLRRPSLGDELSRTRATARGAQMTSSADVNAAPPPTTQYCGVTFFELHSPGLKSRTDAISQVEVKPMEGPSRFVQPMCVHFNHYGKKRRWDMISSHPSVAILVYHRGLDAILMVRQFRPPAYVSACLNKPAVALHQAEETPGTSGLSIEDIVRCEVPLEVAFTYELCAGIVDKAGKSLVQIAKEEVMEELGYDVSVNNLKQIATALSAVGISGAQQTLFYAQVDETQRCGVGGGNESEGEAIDVVALPVHEIDAFVAADDISKSPGALFALCWFKLHGAKGP